MLTEEKRLLLFITGHKENRHTVSGKSEIMVTFWCLEIITLKESGVTEL